MNFDAIAENLPMYLEGALITLKLLLLSLACGLALGAATLLGRRRALD